MSYMTSIDQAIHNLRMKDCPENRMLPCIRILYFFCPKDRDILRRVLDDGRALFKLISRLPGANALQDPQKSGGSRTDMLCAGGMMMDLEQYFASRSAMTGKAAPRCLYLKDFHIYDQEKKAARYIKNFLDDPFLKDSILLISSPLKTIPNGFDDNIQLISVPQIDQQDIARLIISMIDDQEKRPICESSIYPYAKQYVGLSHNQVTTIFDQLKNEFGFACEAFAVGQYNPEKFREKNRSLIAEAKRDASEKHTSIQRIGIEESILAVGMENYEAWLAKKKKAFIANNPFAPSGVVFIGISGGGKSLMAKRTAQEFGCELIDFNLGMCKSKNYGESEKNLANYLNEFETMEPLVLRIDEVEKHISDSDTNHEVSSGLLGSLLSWMAEKKKRVFLYFTANNISRVPMELFRPDRVDAVFFVGMPWGMELSRILQSNLISMDKEWKAAGTNGFLDPDLIARLIAAQKENNADPYCQDVIETFAREAKAANKDFLFTGSDLSQLIKDAGTDLFEQDIPLPFDGEAFKKAMLAQLNGNFRTTGQKNMNSIVNLYRLCVQNDYVPVSAHRWLEDVAANPSLSVLPKKTFSMEYDNLLYERVGSRLLIKN